MSLLFQCQQTGHTVLLQYLDAHHRWRGAPVEEKLVGEQPIGSLFLYLILKRVTWVPYRPPTNLWSRALSSSSFPARNHFIMTWKDIAAAKQRHRAEKIPEQWRIPSNLMPSEQTLDVQDWPRTSGFFTSEELCITELTASELVRKIAKGELKAAQAVEAICKRASVAQQLINCVTEIYFDEAISRAKELDAYFEKEGRTIGPLHGLPISLKDQFNLKGLDTTIGYISWAAKPAIQDSTLVTLLYNAGAIPFVKTNVPATLMMGESVNNVFGRTLNPRNRELTTGGSSGGESALVTFRGSYIGVGTDSTNSEEGLSLPQTRNIQFSQSESLLTIKHFSWGKHSTSLFFHWTVRPPAISWSSKLSASCEYISWAGSCSVLRWAYVSISSRCAPIYV